MSESKFKVKYEVLDKESSFREITYGICGSPFGEVFLAATGAGICYLQFCVKDENFYKENLVKKWKNSSIKEDKEKIHKISEKVFLSNVKEVELHLKGTDFQLQVWRTLLSLPGNRLFFYQELASFAGFPTAVRAVANAVGKNPVHYLVPCHQIVRKDGGLGGYAGGVDKKKLILSAENLI